MYKHLLLVAVIAIYTNYTSAQAITETEATTVAKQIETAVQKGGPDVLTPYFDKEGFGKVLETKCSYAKEPGFMTGFMEGFNFHDLDKAIIAGSETGGYRLVNTYIKNDGRHLVFRMFGKGGINYHDFVLYKKQDKYLFNDMYIMVSGELISNTMSDMVEGLMSGTSDVSQASEKGQAMFLLSSYKRQGKYLEIRNTIDSLNPELRRTNAMQIMYVQASKQLSEESYKRALEQYAAYFPDAPNVYLMMLDLYFLNKEYNKALYSVNKLDTLVHTDPFLDFYRGNIYIAQEKRSEAKACFSKAFQYDPSMPLTMLQLVTCYALDKEYDKAKLAIQKYKETPGFQQSYIDNVYAEYPDLKK